MRSHPFPRPLRFLAAPALAALVLLSPAVAAPDAARDAAAAEPGRLCDRLAAYEGDPDRRGPAVPFEAFDPASARAACTAAVARDPSERRWRFQLARAHYALGDFDTAHHLLEQSAEDGSGGAWYVLGRLFHHGDGVRLDHAAALSHYLEAARLGAAAGVAGALKVYADPQSPAHDPAKVMILTRDPSAAWSRYADLGAW